MPGRTAGHSASEKTGFSGKGIKKTGQKLTRLEVPANAQGECGEDQVAGFLENARSNQRFRVPRIS
jgi:hypothetical protein